MDPCHLVPYDITHDALPIQKELLNARIESYLIQHLPLELTPEPVVGDDTRDRLAIMIDLVHSVVSADARLDGVKRVRIDILKNACLRCYGSEDQDRYGSKTFGDVVSAFEKSNILDFSFGLIKGTGYGIV
ncbi:unnamed protein product [Clonostachys byssicola]|uniref:Uncharacterized protein n=1 Tax=Clonostachys byssicola TaxID=160290 RepID=A0A9N9Y2X0_9HYPO|nr:unnamed protein product [Clonostachys byssicola]